MKAVRVVLGEALIGRLDRVARKAHLSRSAFIRQALEETLRARSLLALVEQERAGYLLVPVARDEVSTLSALKQAQQKVLSELADEDLW